MPRLHGEISLFAAPTDRPKRSTRAPVSAPIPPRSRRIRLRITLALLALCAGSACVDAEPEPPHVVLITVDTLRADHLSAYGYERATSPNLKRLSDAGLRFDNAMSQAPWTLPSMASMHSSMYPREHAAHRAAARIDERAPMVAEAFRDAGYHTIGLSSHIFVDARRGFDRGFEIFDETFVGKAEWVTSSAQLTDQALGYVDQSAEGPFFLWVHYFDPHQDWMRHPNFDFAGKLRPQLGNGLRPDLIEKRLKRRLRLGEIRYMVDTYDEEIAYTDHHVGRLIDGVKEKAAGRPVVFAFSADHGELLMEHGRFGHGRELYRELINVPLIFGGDLPDELQGRVVSEAVETLSVPKTLLGLAGIPSDPFAGDDLAAVARGDRPAPERVFSEGSDAWGLAYAISVVEGPWKLIYTPRGKRYELYNLERDPKERTNLWRRPDAREASKRLAEAIRTFELRERGQAGSLDIPDEERSQLEALGYVE